MICNSAFVAPRSFSGGTGGTGGTLRDSARQSGTGAWDRGTGVRLLMLGR